MQRAIRFFFIGGVVGGVGYLLLCASTLRAALTADPTTLALVVAALVVFVFETGSVFGLAPFSFLSALAFGYAQRSPGGGSSALAVRAAPIWRWDTDHGLGTFRN